MKKWRERNKEYIKRYNKKWLEKNPEYKKDYYIRNKEKILKYGKKYRKENPEYCKNNHKKNKKRNLKNMQIHYEKNKDKYNKLMKKWREENKDKLSEYQRKYLKTEKGKANNQRGQVKRRNRMKNIINTLTCKEWEDILKKYNFRCAYCGIEFDENNLPEKDHIVPISKGGNNTKENVVPACRRCNAKKKDTILKIACSVVDKLQQSNKCGYGSPYNTTVRAGN